MSVRRLDAELVSRGIARSRENARELIDSGAVTVDGITATKASRGVTPDSKIVLTESAEVYVSRGAFKLLGALDTFEVSLERLVVLDAGSSTGGFTEVALERGATRVFAVDVGYGQLAWKLRSDDRVTVMERTNIRNVTRADFDQVPDVAVADLSFISLVSVLPALTEVVSDSGFLLLMVKPQFEAGREAAAIHHGVIKDLRVRADAVLKVATKAAELGWDMKAVAASPLPGPKGNVEYFLWLVKVHPPITQNVASPTVDTTQWSEMITRAVQEGPE